LRHYKAGNRSIKRVVHLPSNSAVLAFDPSDDHNYDIRLELEVNADINPFKDMTDAVTNDFTVFNIVPITKATCSPGFKYWGLSAPNPKDKSDSRSKFNVISARCGMYPCARHIKAEVSKVQFSRQSSTRINTQYHKIARAQTET
jgi:hypothetical protein